MPKKRQKERRKYALITLIISVFVALIVISSLNQPIQPTVQKPPVTEYLQIQHTKSIGERKTADNRTILIKTLGLKITAVRGDATNIAIDVPGAQDIEYIEKISKGETREIQILSQGYLVELDENGVFPITFDAWSSEAEAAPVTVYARPEDFVLLDSGLPHQ